MNSRDRLLTALDHREPDRIPLDLGAGKCCQMHIQFYRKLLKHFGIDEDPIVTSMMSQAAYASPAVLERLESDVRAPFPSFVGAPVEKWEDDAYLYYRDAMGVGFRMPKSKPLYYDMYDFPLADEEARATYRWPEPLAVNPEALRQIEAFRAAGYPVAFVDHYADGFLQTGCRLFGYDEWMMLLGMEEDEVKLRLDQLLELKMRQHEITLTTCGDTIDVICDTDDLGMQNGTFISPDMFRNCIKPYWAKLFAHIKKFTKAKIFMHSCGSVRPFIGDLIDIGLDILNPVQISAANMDPAELKKEFGKDLVFWGGGVDTQKVLPTGTPQQVRDNVKRNIDLFAPGGGYVFATVHNTQADVPLENFLAMWETFLDNRTY